MTSSTSCWVNTVGTGLPFLGEATATGMASPVAMQRSLVARPLAQRQLWHVLDDVVDTRRVIVLDAPLETLAGVLLSAAVHPDGKGVGATRWSCQPGFSPR
jgi:hypothetical protein